MTETDWFTDDLPYLKLNYIKHRTSDRKLRLIGCGYCRLLWDYMGRASRRAIFLGEQMADGPVNESKRDAVINAAIQAVIRYPSCQGRYFEAADMAYRTPCNDGWYAVEWTMGNFDYIPGGMGVLRDIIGNPFNPPTISPAWLSPKVLGLATTIYQERSFDLMPALADALEAAGCGDATILDHCRSGDLHVRGCWLVDGILGKL